MLVVALGTLVVPLDSSVNFAFPFVTRAFGLPMQAIQWLVVSYTLTYAALMLVFGRVGDIFGYRRVFLAGSMWSSVAFVVCALATSYSVLLVGRVLQGVGAALVLSCGPALATSFHSELARTRILSTYTMVIGIGGALGPLIAGLLVPMIDWPAVFWFRAPLALAAFLLAWLLPADEQLSHRQTFDAVGGALLVLMISTLLVSLNLLQHIAENKLWITVSTLACVVTIATFAFQEHRAARPIINLRFFRDIDFSLLNAGNAAINLAGFSVLLLVPFYLSRLSGLSAYETGLLLASSPTGTVLAAPLAARLATGIAPRLLAMFGASAMAIGQIAISATGADPSYICLAGSMALQGFGVGLFQVAYFDIITAVIPRADRGVAGSLAMMTRTLGTVTGATVLMLLFRAWHDGALASGASEVSAFVSAFGSTFLIAATLPTLVVLLGLLRGWGRRLT